MRVTTVIKISTFKYFDGIPIARHLETQVLFGRVINLLIYFKLARQSEKVMSISNYTFTGIELFISRLTYHLVESYF